MPKNPAAIEEYQSADLQNSKNTKNKKLVNLGYKLSEAQCRYAMANTSSNAEAAKWLHISYETWSKYAKSYIDEATQVTLFELHKQGGPWNKKVLPKKQYRKKTQHPRSKWFTLIPLEEIIVEGKHPNYTHHNLKTRLINEGIKAERCERCGYQERRATDYTAPIKFHFKDGNRKNLLLSNLEFVCWNCAYLLEVGWTGRKKQYVINEETGEIEPKNLKRPRVTHEEQAKLRTRDFLAIDLESTEELNVVVDRDDR